MKNKLENFIQENRKSLDELEPPAGLWSKIEKKLDKKEPKKQKLNYTWMRVAAVLTVLIGAYWAYNMKTKTYSVDIADINPAYAKKQLYVVNQIEEKRDSLASFEKTDPNLVKDFNIDLSTLDIEYEKLKNDLKTSLNQPAVVKAMVKNREMQLQILNQQLQIVNELNERKNTINSVL